MRKWDARAAKRKHAKALKRVDRARPARPVEAPSTVPTALRDRHAHRRVRDEAYWAAFRDLSTDEICEYAQRHLGVRWTEESFRTLAEGAVSSWELALDKLWPLLPSDAPKSAPGFLALAVTVLWERWLPDRPSKEMIDDLLEEGSRHLDEERPADAVRAWCDFWSALQRASGGARALEVLDQWVIDTTVSDWADVFLDVALEGLQEAPELRPYVERTLTELRCCEGLAQGQRERLEQLPSTVPALVEN